MMRWLRQIRQALCRHPHRVRERRDTAVAPQVLLDAISQITETPNKFQGLPLGARAVLLADMRARRRLYERLGMPADATVDFEAVEAYYTSV